MWKMQAETIKNVVNYRRIALKTGYRDLGAVLLFLLFVPYAVSFFFGNTGQGAVGEGEEAAVEEEGMFREDAGKAEYIVYNKTYLTGYLPATIDMDYEMEALKAQAVVLRTELMKLAEEDGKHIYVESGNVPVGEEAYERSKEAVSSTRGMFLM